MTTTTLSSDATFLLNAIEDQGEFRFTETDSAKDIAALIELIRCGKVIATATPRPASPVLKLSHGSQIRVKGFEFRNKITVGTVAGYAKSHGQDPQEAITRQKEFGNPLEPWSCQAASVLEGDYPGKAAKIQKQRDEHAASPEVQSGTVVEIEGALYKVIITGEQYSNPVLFVPHNS